MTLMRRPERRVSPIRDVFDLMFADPWARAIDSDVFGAGAMPAPMGKWRAERYLLAVCFQMLSIVFWHCLTTLGLTMMFPRGSY